VSLVALAAAGCAGRGVTLPWKQEKAATAEQAVWRAALDSLYGRPGVAVALAGRSAELPARGTALRWWLRSPSNADPAAFADFRARNRAPAPLGEPPRLGERVAIVDEAELAALQTGGDSAWRRFFERHAGSPGVLELTRVGFRPDSQQAFFVVRRTCGAACGDLAAVVVAREPSGAWQLRERHVVERRTQAAAGAVERTAPRPATRAPARPPTKAPAKPPAKPRTPPGR
jgi:hypothetical protein